MIIEDFPISIMLLFIIGIILYELFSSIFLVGLNLLATDRVSKGLLSSCDTILHHIYYNVIEGTES